MTYDKLTELVTRKQWSDLETTWLECVQQPDADPAKLLPVIDATVKADQADLAATLGWAWLSAMKAQNTPREALRLGRGLLLRLPDGEQLREEILDLYVQTHSERDDLDWWVDRSGLKAEKSVRRALRYLDTGLRLEPGTALYHRTDDEAARVLEADLKEDEIELQAGKRTRVMSVDEVIENYDIVDENDFRVLRQMAPETIADLVKRDPAALVIGIVRSRENRIDRDELKFMLVPSFIASTGWSAWWTRLRGAIKKSTQLRIEGRSPMMILFDAAGRTPEQETREALAGASTPREWLEILQNYLRDTKNQKKDPDAAFLAGVQAMLTERIERFARHNEPGAALATALVIERVAADGLPISTDVHGTALRMLQESGDPVALAASLPDARLWPLGLQCVEQAFPEEWPATFSRLVLYAPMSRIDGMVKAVEKAGQGDLLIPVVKQVLANPGRHTEALMWLWKRPTTKTELPVPGDLKMFGLVMGLVGPARESEGKAAGQTVNEMRAKVRAGLAAKSYDRFRALVEAQPDDMAPALRRQIERADGLGPSARDELIKILRIRFPDLYVAKRVEMWEDEQVLYFSEAGLSARHSEIDQLVNVKMRENAKAIGDAAAHGDLSENSEYRFALEERDLLRARLAQLNKEADKARVIKADEVQLDRVGICQRITLRPKNGGDALVVTTCGVGESDINVRKYAYNTPLALRMMGKAPGEAVTLMLVDDQEAGYHIESIENDLVE